MIKQVHRKYKILPTQARASFWFLICSFAQKAISTITSPLFTRLLSPEEYGQFTVFSSWYSILSIVIALCLSAGMYTQSLVKFSDCRMQYTSSMQGLTLTLVCFWTAVYLLFHSFWNCLFGLTTVQMLAMLLMIWTSSVVGFWSARQRVEYRYRSLVIVTLLVSVAKPVVGIFCVTHAEDKVTARILGIALVELTAYTGLFISQMRRGKTFFNEYFWKRALVLAIPLIPHYLAQTLLGSADRIMIKEMVGERAAGTYGLAYSISLVMTMFNSALMQALGPWIYKKIEEHQESDMTSINYLSLVLIASVNLALIALSPEVVSVFAPPSYHEAIWVIPTVAMSTVFTFSYDWIAAFAFYYEKTRFISVASVISALLNILLNAIFIPIFGYYAAGYTTLVCYIVYATAHYFSMRKICNKFSHNANWINWRILLVIYTGFMICGFCLMGCYNHPVVRYGIVCIPLIAMIAFRKRIWNIIRHFWYLRQESKG